MKPTPIRVLSRGTASLLIVAQLAWSCATTSSVQKIEDAKFAFPAASGQRIRIVVRDFRNSAKVDNFDIVPDARYEKGFLRRGTVDVSTSKAVTWEQPTGSSAPDAGAKAVKADTASTPAPDKKTEAIAPDTKSVAIPPPAPIAPAQVAREVTETLMAQSGHFEVIPQFRLAEALKPKGDDAPPSLKEAAAAIDTRYVLYGDLTNFEIRAHRSYWKIPLWAILLVGALLIRDRNTREFALNVLLRLMFYTPLNSALWRNGIGWEDLELDVEISLALRLVDTQTGLVVATTESEITRRESVRNLDLLIWASDERLKITESNAGRQIRFAAHQGLLDLIEQTKALPAQ